MDKTAVLKKTFLFGSLLQDEIRAISDHCASAHFKQNEIICRQGERNDKLYLIGSGQVKVSVKDLQGVERPLSFLSSGSSFGEMSLITGEPTSANVTAVIDTELFTIQKEDFQRILDRYPSLPLKISVLLSHRLKETNLNLKRLEKGFTLLAAFNEWEEPLGESSVGLALSLAENFNKKVILLLFSKGATQEKCEAWLKKPLEKTSENDVFAIYAVSENLQIGLLKAGGEKLLPEKGTLLLSDLFSSYDQILASAPYEEDLDKKTFFSQAKKAIYFFPGKAILENRSLSKLAFPKNAQKALAFFKDDSPIEGVAREARKQFNGPLFVFPSLDRLSAPSSGIHQAARFILNKTIGIVLGGGGARGFAHIGVLKALEKRQLLPDAYCGSSMGGIVASFYARGLGTEEATRIIYNHAKKKGNKFDFHFPYRSLIKGHKLKKMAMEVYGNKTLEEFLHPLYLVCADLVTGEEVVLEKGLLREAVYASADLPGVMPPVRMEDKFLIDGSLLNKVPVSVLKERGIDHVIAVNVTPKKDPSFFKSNPHILNIISRTFDLVNYKLSYAEIGPLDLLIQPKLGTFDFFGFKDIEGIVRVGEEAAEAAMEKIEEIAFCG